MLLSLSDRILVLAHGEVSGIVRAEDVTKEEIGLMMVGQKLQAKEAAAGV